MSDFKPVEINEDGLLEEEVVALLLKNKYTITTAESCTGGLISGTIVNVSGASDVFNEGYVTYSNEAKNRLLGVKKETLEKFGAVSEQVAMEMAKGALNKSNADVAVAVTGIAGPGGGTKEKPVGLVYIGVAVKEKVSVNKFNFDGDRLTVRKLTVANALAMVKECVSEYNK
ncbi:MAG: CinA family protein [Lachnospiraceae bacterium]|nr:CinA family protein [Lachnospiraceae bacterium]